MIDTILPYENKRIEVILLHEDKMIDTTLPRGNMMVDTILLLENRMVDTILPRGNKMGSRLSAHSLASDNLTP